MLITKFTEKYISAAVELGIQELAREQEKCPVLCLDNVKEKLHNVLRELMEDDLGIAAIEDGKLIAYALFFGPIEGFFGTQDGAFSPLGGTAFGENDKLCSKVMATAMDEMVQRGITSLALSRPASDEITGRSLVLNGFGIRCSDAIYDLNMPIEAQDCEGITFGETDDIKEIHDLQVQLCDHLAAAPALFPTPGQFFTDWIDEPFRCFVARKNGKIIGYIKLGDEGENLLTEVPNMGNINGAFFAKEARGTGAAHGLLKFMCDTLKAEGCTRLGTDYETLNPTALRFWTKHFTPYTYSYHRRFDERIVGYEQYISKYR